MIGFDRACKSYLATGGCGRYIEALQQHFGWIKIDLIDQCAIDEAAMALYPDGSPATRNRQVYTPMIAILRHSGIVTSFKRPKGAGGKARLHWLTPEQSAALLASAWALEPRFGALLTFLLGTGCRIGEALRLEWRDIDLTRSYALIRETKNGDSRPVHLPPAIIGALEKMLPFHGFPSDHSKVFAISRTTLTRLLDKACAQSGVVIPDGVAFHIFRHTYGAMMRRYGGLDTSGLVATGAWKSRSAASVYEHVDVSAEARKADLMPIAMPS